MQVTDKGISFIIQDYFTIEIDLEFEVFICFFVGVNIYIYIYICIYEKYIGKTLLM